MRINVSQRRGMSERGRLTEWNDERGFGFVTPLDGGPKLFAHVSEFPREFRRPQLNDLVTYDPTVDERGRPQARSLRFLTPAHERNASSRSPLSIQEPLVAVGFFALLGMLVLLDRIPASILGLYAVMSLLLFSTYAQDKAAAQSGRWRTPEATLHLMALVGGWPGALVAQGVFRHKTRKQPFRTIFFASVLANCALLVILAVWTLPAPG
jgi:uncharacterized membrane protein YsdA (DUF1294 family)/cold shock CspA family protein